MFLLRLKYFFINLFRLSHEIYDDSLEPFEAQRVALEMFEKEDQVFKNRASLKIIKEQQKMEDIEEKNHARFDLNYLYTHKR